MASIEDAILKMFGMNSVEPQKVQAQDYVANAQNTGRYPDKERMRGFGNARMLDRGSLNMVPVEGAPVDDSVAQSVLSRFGVKEVAPVEVAEAPEEVAEAPATEPVAYAPTQQTARSKTPATNAPPQSMLGQGGAGGYGIEPHTLWSLIQSMLAAAGEGKQKVDANTKEAGGFYR